MTYYIPKECSDLYGYNVSAVPNELLNKEYTVTGQSVVDAAVSNKTTGIITGCVVAISGMCLGFLVRAGIVKLVDYIHNKKAQKLNKGELN